MAPAQPGFLASTVFLREQGQEEFPAVLNHTTPPECSPSGPRSGHPATAGCGRPMHGLGGGGIPAGWVLIPGGWEVGAVCSCLAKEP